MSERMVAFDGVEIATESFGDPADPPLLLIMGAKASMIWWPEPLCRRLAERGRFVIRYDHRDTGRSTSYEPGAPGYTLVDLAHDALGVLDAYGIDRAHVVGMSMGGILGQILALDRPGRVASLTVIASTPLGYDGPELPALDPAVLAHVLASADLDSTDEAAIVSHMVEAWRLMAGSAYPFEGPAAHKLATAEFRRARTFASTANHHMLEAPEAYNGRLGEVGVPTVVIHGTADPVLPFAHGQAIAGAIPGANLLSLEGTGHELHPGDWDKLIDAIARHTDRA